MEVDAVIAGGGVAGSAAAAALASLGWSVLIVEPGQHAERRLAGELIHPAGVAGLRALGLLADPALAGAARLDGFAVFRSSDPTDHVHLPYADPHGALALDHACIAHALLAQVAARPGVAVAAGWRVAGLDHRSDAPVVQLRQGGATETLRCRLVVAADGASSPVRGFAGLRHRRVRNAVLTGCVTDAAALPRPASGHVFTGAGGPVLAYALGGGRARVLFNRPLPAGAPARPHTTGLDGLSPMLRHAVDAALPARLQHFVCSDVTVPVVARGRVVLTGDAAGTCHPISATGMTMGIADALRLREALRQCDGAAGAALRLYASERRARQRARALLAAMLHEVFAGAGPEMGLLRSALHRYWSGSTRARAVSMALLGMDALDTRTVLAEFLRVAAAGLSAPAAGRIAPLRRAGLLARTSWPMMHHMLAAMWA